MKKYFCPLLADLFVTLFFLFSFQFRLLSEILHLVSVQFWTWPWKQLNNTFTLVAMASRTLFSKRVLNLFHFVTLCLCTHKLLIHFSRTLLLRKLPKVQLNNWQTFLPPFCPVSFYKLHFHCKLGELLPATKIVSPPLNRKPFVLSLFFHRFYFSQERQTDHKTTCPCLLFSPTQIYQLEKMDLWVKYRFKLTYLLTQEPENTRLP